MTGIFTRDALLRVFHTFWQAFLGAAVTAFVASGLDVSQIVDISSAKKFGLALGAALLGAALSALKATFASITNPVAKPEGAPNA